MNTPNTQIQPDTNEPKPIEVFRVGKFTAMDGRSLEFSAADLQEIAQSYNAELHESPLVVGHPSIDAPAYGWADRFSVENDKLLVHPKQVAPAFAKAVNDGAYKKVSVKLYLRDTPNSPVPGKLYVKHIGFLGGAAPAVEGLRAASFSAADDGCAEFSADFSAYDGLRIAQIFRRFREFLIEKFGTATADQVVSGWEIDSLTESAMAEERNEETLGPLASFASEPNHEDMHMSKELEEKMAAIAAQEAELKAQSNELAARELALKRQTASAEFSAFVNELEAEGKLLPVEAPVAVELLSMLSERTEPASFAAGDENHGKSGVDLLKGLLASQPVRVTYQKVSGSKAEGGAAAFAAPEGCDINAEALEVHNRALAYQKTNNVDYLTAVRAVQ